jgi:hypothetical protein
MLTALRTLMAPPSVVVLGGVVAAVGAFARLFRRPSSNHTTSRSEQQTPFGTAVGETGSDAFDAFLLSIRDHRSGR